jgi:hypothetical protein
MADAGLDEYFDAARQIGPALEAAFSEGPGYEARLREIIGALSGGRPMCVPAVGVRSYAPATVRVLDPGGTVYLHCGNETYAFPALGELTKIIDPSGEISTLLPLALPETGGELEVYDVCFGDPLIDEWAASSPRRATHTCCTTGASRRWLESSTSPPPTDSKCSRSKSPIWIATPT